MKVASVSNPPPSRADFFPRYNGSAPFTGDALSEQPATWPWSSFTSGERWMAFTNASGYGVGVVSPSVAHFGSGFFNDGVNGAYDCVPKGLGPYDPQTGYIAPWSTETIDPKSPFAYSFALVLGPLASIRAYAAQAHQSGRDQPLTPHYSFAGCSDRMDCFVSDAEDGGLPIGARGLELNVSGPHPLVSSPITVFAPAAVPVVRVNASHDASLGSGVESVLWWWRFGDDVGGSPCAACVLGVPAIADGAFHTYDFDVSSVPSYAGAEAITRIVYQPLGAADVSPSVFGRPGIVAVASILAAPAQ